jgi:hypothetical protein
MGSGADGNELRQSLHDSQDDGLDDGHWYLSVEWVISELRVFDLWSLVFVCFPGSSRSNSKS